MKKFISLFLSLAIALVFSMPVSAEKYEPSYTDIESTEFARYLEALVYSDLIGELDSDEYLVENVQVVYISQEYAEEVAYNTRANIYFGYTMAELNSAYQGQRYVFTLSDDGQTTVQEFVEFSDDTMSRIIRNVAIGTGVILICVTVTVLTAGTGAHAVNMIFAAGAQGGIILSGKSAVFGAVTTGVVELCKTGNLNDAAMAAAIGASEGFKFGAVAGTLIAGGSEALALKGATLNGLTMNQAAEIQQKTGWSYKTISQIKSYEEAAIYEKADLFELTIPTSGGPRTILARGLDLELTTYYETTGEWLTNLQRMQKGLAPVYIKDGAIKSYQLHHINQEVDGVLALLTSEEHLGNAGILNTFGKAVHTTLTAAKWTKQRKEVWMALAELITG